MSEPITINDCIHTALVIQQYLQDRARQEVLLTNPPFRSDARTALRRADKLIADLLDIQRQDGWDAKRKDREAQP